MRVVVLDPSYSSSVGHHQEINSDVLQLLSAAGHQVEVWADQAGPVLPGVRLVSSGSGYVDPRHWADLGGCLHLAARLKNQWEFALSGASVDFWLAHSLLPFQEMALAQLLQSQPSARILLSLMFAPGETFEGMQGLDPQRLRANAELNARTAHLAMAQACRHAGHSLTMAVNSLTTLNLHQPLLQAAGLSPALQHPAIVGAGCRPVPVSAAEPMVLLHWGDLKPDKGSQESVALLRALLKRPVESRPPWRWLFHVHSEQSLLPEDQRLLRRASHELSSRLVWLNRQVSSSEMQQWLSQCSLALLAYSPTTYAERSSGVLWCYAAARYSLGLPAHAVGYGGHWLQHESINMGMDWTVAPLAAGTSDGDLWLSAIETAMAKPSYASWMPAADQLLGQSFADWVLAQLS